MRILSVLITAIAVLKDVSGAEVPDALNASECVDNDVGWNPLPSFPGCNDDSILCNGEDLAVMENCCKCRCTSSAEPDQSQNHTSCYTPPVNSTSTISLFSSPPSMITDVQDNNNNDEDLTEVLEPPSPTPPPTNYYQNWKANGGREDESPINRFFFIFFALFFFMTILLKGNQLRAHRRLRRYRAARAERLRRAVILQEQQRAGGIMPPMPGESADDAARYERIVSKFYFQAVLPDQSNVNPESLKKPADVERPSISAPPKEEEEDDQEEKKKKEETNAEINETIPSAVGSNHDNHQEPDAAEESIHQGATSSKSTTSNNHHPSLCEVISSWASVGSSSPPSDVCCICLEGYSVGDTIGVAKKPTCDHLFHKDCVLEWMKTNDECPLCRVNLLH